MHIIPTTIVDAFAKGDILEVVFVSILFGFAMSAAGTHAKPLVTLLESLTKVVFRMVNIVMHFAPIGAFGAMAFTIGKYGLSSLGPLLQPDRVVLGDFDSLRLHCVRRSGVARGIFADEISLSH